LAVVEKQTTKGKRQCWLKSELLAIETKLLF